ncbi:MAG: AzlC family ABC transporter permease [Clostridia bacterium]|nr:AzlC family ABC transporter permease [Clostridia bacterium]
MTDKNFKRDGWKFAFKSAFPHTLPILAGFLFLGMSYGFYMRTQGFSALFPIIMSVVIFGGSLEFVTVSMLLSPFAPVTTFFMALVIQARHLFYGVSMLDKYKGAKKLKPYLIFGMCDESFSINCSVKIPEGADKNKFYFCVTALNHFYWVAGAALGALIGGLVSFNTEGIEFVMTAMFVVIFLENWLKEKRHVSSLIGVLSSVLCLVIFGKDHFLIPAMVVIACLLSLFRKPVCGGDEE